jgi:hypothetical protein
MPGESKYGCENIYLLFLHKANLHEEVSSDHHRLAISQLYPDRWILNNQQMVRSPATRAARPIDYRGIDETQHAKDRAGSERLPAARWTVRASAA